MENKTTPGHSEAKAAEARLEAAKESLTHRFDELHRRFSDAKHKLSAHDQIVKHPWPSVGIAFAIGALLGFSSSHKVTRIVQENTMGGKLSEAFIGLLGTLALKLLREAAVKQFGGAAKQWWDQQDRAATDDAKYAPPF